MVGAVFKHHRSDDRSPHCNAIHAMMCRTYNADEAFESRVSLFRFRVRLLQCRILVGWLRFID